ncbi:MAG: DUF4124 domain-containing protein [Burkholderiales bacterium]|nr:DUF4124 domain-containing protein [Burkholderiales bacterium]
MSLKFASLVIVLAGTLVVGDAGAAAAKPKREANRAPAGKIYKWVDERGVTHYGEIIPPQYRDKSVTQLNQRGVAVKRIDGVLTPEQQKAAEERAEREKAERKQLAAQRRRDMALMNTYTSTKEIEVARTRNLAMPQQAIKGLQPRLKQAQARLATLEGQADKQRDAGRQVPEHLAEDIARQKQVVAEIRADIDRHSTDIESINRRFDADKQRYAELTELAHR